MSSFTRLAIVSTLVTACIDSEPYDLGEISSEVAVSDTYNAIRAVEGNFPLPTPTIDTVVGTFNAYNGAYTGLQSEYDWVIDQVTGKPKQIRIIPHVSVDAVHVGLGFNITNRGSQVVSLTVNGVTATAPAGQSYIVVSAEKAKTVDWTLVVGNKTKTDKLIIDRPYIVGGGVFTVAALPISVIYEPPQDIQLRNKTTYSITRSIANTFSMSLKDESSTAKPARPAKYQDVAEIKSAIGALVTALGPAPNVPNKATVIAGFNAISNALGSVSGVQTNGTSNQADSSLTIKDTWSASLSTSAHLGPGAGDRILYLKNARFVWISDRGDLTVALLGYDTHATHGVQTLKADLATFPPFPMRNEGVGPATGLSRATLQALLALDPFVAGGPNVVLDPTRFVAPSDSPPQLEGSGGEDHYTVEHSVSATDKTASTNFATLVTDARAGWLSFAGIGVTETSTVKTTTTHTQSNELVINETVKTVLDLYSTGTEVYRVNVFYDRVFGGFAFQTPSLTTVPVTNPN